MVSSHSAVERRGSLDLPAAHLQFIAEAAEYLEQPRFLMRAANLLGKPAEAVLHALPLRAQSLVGEATSEALRRGLEWAIWTLPLAPTVIQPPSWPSAERRVSTLWHRHRHTALAAMAGAGGGLLGMPGLAAELPATTMLMLRSIASIAAEHGADLSDPRTRIDCLTVLSIGSQPLEEMDSAYFTARMGLAMAVRKAKGYVATHSAQELGRVLVRGARPPLALVRLLNKVAARFQIVVTQKMAAQAVPITGALLGAAVNAAFTDHFNRVAHYHFGIVSLEQLHGRHRVQQAYEAARRT